MSRQSGKATGASVLGIAAVATAVVGVGLPLGAAAVILGMRALREIDAAGGEVGGERRARLGIGLGRIGASSRRSCWRRRCWSWRRPAGWGRGT